MRFVKKTLCILLAMFMVVGLFSNVTVNAKETTIPTPKIKVKTVKNGTGIKITISKTKEAEGYEVYLNCIDDIYSKYREQGSNYDVDKIDLTEFQYNEYYKFKEINKNGKSKRTVTINTLPAGKYKIKVRSYNNSKYGTLTYSKFSKVKTVKLKEQENIGYKTSYDFSKVKKGDVIKFGAYEQDGNFINGKEPIEWIVLSKNEKEMFVISKYALDCLPYNKEDISVSWEDCTLRKWLNNSFYTKSFNESEKDMIKTSLIDNHDSATYGTNGERGTNDNIILLSQLEIINNEYGFDKSYNASDVNRRCASTPYATIHGVLSFDYFSNTENEGSCYWWLRSPGKNTRLASGISFDGSVDLDGSPVHSFLNGVRPAMFISLK